jgi:hypothetical protein
LSDLVPNILLADKYRGGQNNGNTKKRRIKFVLATLKELQLATLNVLAFVYTQ